MKIDAYLELFNGLHQEATHFGSKTRGFWLGRNTGNLWCDPFMGSSLKNKWRRVSKHMRIWQIFYIRGFAIHIYPLEWLFFPDRLTLIGFKLLINLSQRGWPYAMSVLFGR